jgi:hypothetical protein
MAMKTKEEKCNNNNNFSFTANRMKIEGGARTQGVWVLLKIKKFLLHLSIFARIEYNFHDSSNVGCCCKIHSCAKMMMMMMMMLMLMLMLMMFA